MIVALVYQVFHSVGTVMYITQTDVTDSDITQTGIKTYWQQCILAARHTGSKTYWQQDILAARQTGIKTDKTDYSRQQDRLASHRLEIYRYPAYTKSRKLLSQLSG